MRCEIINTNVNILTYKHKHNRKWSTVLRLNNNGLTSCLVEPLGFPEWDGCCFFVGKCCCTKSLGEKNIRPRFNLLYYRRPSPFCAYLRMKKPLPKIVLTSSESIDHADNPAKWLSAQWSKHMQQLDNAANQKPTCCASLSRKHLSTFGTGRAQWFSSSLSCGLVCFPAHCQLIYPWRPVGIGKPLQEQFHLETHIAEKHECLDVQNNLRKMCRELLHNC